MYTNIIRYIHFPHVRSRYIQDQEYLENNVFNYIAKKLQFRAVQVLN